MDRRTFLTAMAGSGIATTSGCFGSVQRFIDHEEFELVDPELDVDDSPDVSVEDDTVTVRGTIRYGSSSCSTVKLAHAEYEDSQNRLDLLIVAADDSDGKDLCTDDLRSTGYRIKTTIEGDLDYITATEHHRFGDTYSISMDLRDN